MTGRAARPLTAAEHDREALLLGQAQALDERIGKLLALKALSQEQDKLLEDLKRQASELRRQVLELEQQFESKYRRPRRPARHARSRPEGPPRRDGPRRLDRSGSLPLGLPAAALRRPRLGPAPRLRQGRRLDQGGERTGTTPPRRAQPGNHQRPHPPAGRGGGAAAARAAEGASPGGQPAGRREFAGTGGRAHRGADGGAAGPGLGRHHRRLCPLGLDVRVPRGQADAPRPRPHAAGPGRSGLSRDEERRPRAHAAGCGAGHRPRRPQRQRRPQRHPGGGCPAGLRGDHAEAARRPQDRRRRRGAQEGAGAVLARGDHPRGRGRRRAARRRDRPPPGQGGRAGRSGRRAGAAGDAGRVARSACPARGARSRRSPGSSPPGRSPP